MDRKTKALLAATSASAVGGVAAASGEALAQEMPPTAEENNKSNQMPETDVDVSTDPSVGGQGGEVSLPPLPEGMELTTNYRTGGETLEGLAARYDVPIDLLKIYNPDFNQSDVIRIPVNTSFLEEATDKEVQDRQKSEPPSNSTPIHGFSASTQNTESTITVSQIAQPNSIAQPKEDKSLIDRGKDLAKKGLLMLIDVLLIDDEPTTVEHHQDYPIHETIPPLDRRMPRIGGVSVQSDKPVRIVVDGVEYTPTHNNETHGQVSYMPTASITTQAPEQAPSERGDDRVQVKETLPVPNSYQDVLSSMPKFVDLPHIQELQQIPIDSPNALLRRSAGYVDKVDWLEENVRPFITPQNYFAFAKDGINTSLAERDLFGPERSSKELSGSCIMYHWMAGKPATAEDAAVAALNRSVTVNMNYVNMPDGNVYQMMPNEKNASYHAGPEINYDCYSVEKWGNDALDFTPQSLMGDAFLAIQRHLDADMPLTRNVVAIEALGVDMFSDFATSDVSDRSIFGSVLAHKEAPRARGKIDALSRYVNLVYELAKELDVAIDQYQRELAFEAEGITIDSITTTEESITGVELNEKGEYVLEVVSPLGRDFTVNDAHNMWRDRNYGPGFENGYHQQGWDVKSTLGETVYAPITGKIHLFPESGGMGNVVMLEADNGVVIQLGHLLDFANGLQDGQLVEMGIPIARVGSTGKATGPHLDIKMGVFTGEIKPFSARSGDGFRSVNPANYFPEEMITYRYSGRSDKGIMGRDSGVDEQMHLYLMEDYKSLFHMQTVLEPTISVSDPGLESSAHNGTGFTYNSSAYNNPGRVVTLEEYKILQRAALSLTGDSHNVRGLLMPDRTISASQLIIPQPETSTTPKPIDSLTVHSSNEVTFKLIEGWQDHLRENNPQLSAEKFRLLVEIYANFVSLANEGYDINPAVATAQVIGESGLGTSELAREANNLMGHTTSPDDPDAYWTWDNGNWRPFKRFLSVKDSLRGYAERITTGSAYPDAAKCHASIKATIIGLQNRLSEEDCRTIIAAHGEEGVMSYAEDPRYESIINDIIGSYGLRDVQVVIDNETGLVTLSSQEGGLLTA